MTEGSTARSTTVLSMVDARAKLTQLPEQLGDKPGVIVVTRHGRTGACYPRVGRLRGPC